MILISGSSEREIVDLQQGDYEEMDQLAVAKTVCKAAFRVLHAEDIGIAIARAIRAACSGRPGGVYLDLPAKLFAQAIDADVGCQVAGQGDRSGAAARSPRSNRSIARSRCLKGAKKPLIILGKGAAYAQADDDIRALVERTGIPYLPMSMAKGLLPDTHPLSAGAARSLVLKDADVVMLIGARLNWLLSHGKGKTWGPRGAQKFVQVDIAPTEMDSNVEIAGTRWSATSARRFAVMLSRIEANWPKPTAWADSVRGKVEDNVAKMAPRLKNNNNPMDYQGALGALREHHQASGPTRCWSTKAPTRSTSRVPSSTSTSRASASTSAPGASWASAWATPSPRPSRPESPSSSVVGDSAFGFSGMEVETMCRYKLPICVVVFNNNGIYRGTDVNPGGTDPAWTTFVKDSHYHMMAHGVRRCRRARHVARRADARRQRGDRQSGKPTLVNAIIDEKAGTESGRIGNLNPQSVVAKKA